MISGDQRDKEYGYTVRQTYLYLRLSLIGTIVAIGLAVVLTPKRLLPDGNGTLHSISHYYYTPARIVFVGALCAAALALLTLAGKGIQSYLLDIAALLAPLIALIPTPVKLNEVATFDPKCATPNDQCIPPDDFEYVRLGFTVWLWLAGLVILIGFVRAGVLAYRARTGSSENEKVPPLVWWTLVVASAIWVFFFWTGNWQQAWFHSNAHFTAAGTFFVIVSLVAWIEAVRQRRRRAGSQDDDTNRRKMTGYLWTYAFIGIVLFLNTIAATVIILVQSKVNTDFAPSGVFIVEGIGLIFFAAFFAVQTFDHRKDGDGWGPLPLTQDQQERRQSEQLQPAAVAGETPSSGADQT